MGGNKIRVSSREMIEVLAGFRSFADEGARNVTAGKPTRSNHIENWFRSALAEGRLPVAISIAKDAVEQDDDWIDSNSANQMRRSLG